MKKINLFFILILILSSCTGMKEAGKILRNEKIKSTDEFLVKKRNPLVLPPNYDKLPKPGSIKKEEENNEDKIKKILKAQDLENINDKSSSVEESILDRIRK